MPKLSILCVVEKNRKAVHQPHLTVTTVIHDLNRRASLCHLSNRLRSKTSFFHSSVDRESFVAYIISSKIVNVC